MNAEEVTAQDVGIKGTLLLPLKVIPTEGGPVLHMLRLTADHLERTGVNAVGLLATDGTIQTGIYENLLSGRGIRVIKPDAPGQRRVMSAIYDGVKAGNLGAIDVAALRCTLDAMIAQGAECFVLGCTELPIVFAQCELPYPVADPTQILAEAAVSFAGLPRSPIT